MGSSLRKRAQLPIRILKNSCIACRRSPSLPIVRCLDRSISKGEISPEQTMVDGLLELSDRNYGWRAESDIQVKKFRGSAFLHGRHAYKITNNGIAISARRGAAGPSLAARRRRIE